MRSVQVYSKEKCPFCVRAMKLLAQQGFEVDEIKLGRDRDRDTFLAELTAKMGTTPELVPQIFIDGQHIGGFTDLAEHLGVDPDTIQAE